MLSRTHQRSIELLFSRLTSACPVTVDKVQCTCNDYYYYYYYESECDQ